MNKYGTGDTEQVDGVSGAFLYFIDEANENFKHWWAVLM